MIGKRSVLMCSNGKSQRTILNDPGSALSETSINQGQERLTKFYIMFAKQIKESDRVHAYPECPTSPRGAVVTDTENSNSHEKDIVMPPLI